MLIYKIALSYYSKIFIKILQFGSTIVVARVAGPSVLGTVAYGIAFVSVFGFISDLGIGSAHIKLISDGEDEANCNTTFGIIRLSLILLYSFVIIGYYLINSYFFNFTFPSQSHRIVVGISFITILFTQLISIPVVIFNSHVEQAKQDIPNIIKTFINQALRIIVVLVGYGAIAISLSSLIAVIIVSPIYIGLVKKYAFGKFDKELFKKYIAISLPLIVVTAVNSFISFGDKLILQHFAGTEQVGYYVAGYRLSDFIFIIAGSVGLLFFPIFTKLIIAHDYKDVNRLISKFENFSFSFILPIVIGVYIFSDLIVDFFLGAKYIHSVEILGVITMSLFIYTVSMPYANIISAIGKFSILALISMFQIFVFIISSLIFVSDFGLELKGYGMSLVILSVYLSYNILTILYSRYFTKQVKILPSIDILLFGITYSVIFYFIYLLTKSDFDYLWKGILLISYFCGYWLLAFLIGVITKKEWLLIAALLDLTKIKEYIISEFKK